MSERLARGFVAAALLFLLLPATLAMALIAALSYPAYPLPSPSPLNLLFDVLLWITIAGLVAAWRAALRYLRGGRAALARIGPPSRMFIAAGAGIGLIGAAIGLEHALGGPARDTVGFALLAPGVVLLAFGWAVWRGGVP